MTLDDESLLTGYLDDELDAAERQAVESALQSDPALADRLRELAATRDLLAGLGHPRCPVDLTSAVASRVERARLTRLARRRALPILVSVGAIAASTVAVVLRMPGRGQHAEIPRGPAGPLVTVKVAPPAVAPSPTDAASPPEEVVASKPTPAPATPVPNAAPPARDEGIARLRELLGRNDVRRVLIVTDVIDAPKQLAEIIGGTARKSADFARIYVHQGLAIDPEHPEQATVFAVVMDGPERAQFLKSIDAFGPKEVGANPELIAQLGDIPDASWLSGKAAAGLGAPPEGLGSIALKAHQLPNGHAIEPQGANGAESVRRRDEEARKGQESVSVVSQPAAPALNKEGNGLDAPGTDGPQVVLVWVTSRAGRPPVR